MATFAELLERMAAIDQALPATDGVACFNRMYRLVIESVQAHVTRWLLWRSGLDRAAWTSSFANLYLSAPRLPTEDAPRAWAAAGGAPRRPARAPLQFALAGMNAHINHDLPVAVVKASADLGTSPDRARTTPTSSASTAPRRRPSRSSASPSRMRCCSALDRTVPGLQDVVANFNMVKARETAWANAETLWALKRSRRRSRRTFSTAWITWSASLAAGCWCRCSRFGDQPMMSGAST